MRCDRSRGAGYPWNPRARPYRLLAVKRVAGRISGGLVLVLATAVVVVMVERSAGGAALGLLGAVLGLLAALAGLQVGMLAGASAFGARVHRVVVGVGGLVREWRSPRRSVVLRAIPVLLSLSVGPGRPPVRLRLWLCGLCSALLGLAVVVVLWLVAGGPLGRGAAIGATATFLHALVPRRSAASTSTGDWCGQNSGRCDRSTSPPRPSSR